MLDELSNLGIVCDPMTQLVVTCEVCRRPSTKECWTCGMAICEFCTLKQHWKVRKPGVPAAELIPDRHKWHHLDLQPE